MAKLRKMSHEEMFPKTSRSIREAMVEAQRWEVRTPRRYGSEHHSWHESEGLARIEAERVAREEWDGAGLQIHTSKRVIYVYRDDRED